MIRGYSGCALLFIYLLLSISSSSQASSRFALSEPVYRQLEQMRAEIDQKNYQPAADQLHILLKNRHLTSYEKAQSWNLLGYTYYLWNQLPKALEAYETVMTFTPLPESLKTSTLRTLAQLWFSEGNYNKALSFAVQMEHSGKSDNKLQLLMAHSHYLLGQYQKSIVRLTPIISSAEKPEENWLQLLRANHQALNQHKKVVTVLEKISLLYPGKTNLMALSAAYSQVNQFDKQLTVLEILQEKGFLDNPQQLKALATLYLQRELPVKALAILKQGLDNKTLEPGFKNLSLAAQAAVQAKNNQQALLLLGAAAQLDKTPESWLMLAQLHANSQNWQMAEKSAKKALGFNNSEIKASLLLGTSLTHQKKVSESQSVISEAVSFF